MIAVVPCKVIDWKYVCFVSNGTYDYFLSLI